MVGIDKVSIWNESKTHIIIIIIMVRALVLCGVMTTLIHVACLKAIVEFGLISMFLRSDLGLPT